eukprot:1179785-Prorocentrum_minimum.AAC.2
MSWGGEWVLAGEGGGRGGQGWYARREGAFSRGRISGCLRHVTSGELRESGQARQRDGTAGGVRCLKRASTMSAGDPARRGCVLGSINDWPP